MAAQTVTKARTHDDYTVGWVCALSKEQTAATAMLDERHDDLVKPLNDPNTYTLGSIGKHNIVIACLPQGEIGTSSAATFATWMISTFPSIKFGLMVGIGGGIPPKVRLGDVVVSTPTNQYPGVVQWDHGKAEKGGQFKQIGSLNSPPALLRTALAKLMTENELSGSKIPEYLDELSQRWPRLVSKYTWSESLKDPLQTSDSHGSQKAAFSVFLNVILSLLKWLFGLWAMSPSDRGVERGPNLRSPVADGGERKPIETRVHYGLIASGNQVIKDAEFRDRLDQRYDGNVLCVEMEAAGLMNNFPCIVIRGICDYADSQKNYDWQEYAAAVAAAFAKELLHYIQPRDVDGQRPVRDIINEVYNDVTHIKSKLDGKDDVEILDWLTRTDYGPQQSDHFNRRQPETGTWFLDSVEFQDWLATGKQTLFCPGIPGAGKTILTSIVVDYLCSKFNNNSTVGIAYIYCNFKMQDEQKIDDLLASVLKQLAESQSCLPESIKNLYNRHKTQHTRPSINEILAVLQSVALMYSRIFIIVDALDECQEYSGCRARFISELSNLQKSSGANIFATSRFIPDIMDKLKGSIEVEIRAHDEDVRKYLESQIMQCGSALLKARCEEVTREITKVVEGMFLLAQLHFETVKRKKTLKKFKNTLANLPTGPKAYDFAYEEAVRRIQDLDSDSKELAWLVLSWITCATRPLATKELQHALAVEIGKAELDEENLVQIEEMVSVCAGLVTIDEESNIIRLVHYTTQEYFERTQKRWFPTAQTEITTICVTYLSFSAFEIGRCGTKEELEERLQLFPFYSYAARSWGHHAPKDKASQEVIKFLKSQAKVEASCQVLMAAGYNSIHVIPRKITGLHLAGIFGLNKATDTLLELGHDPNEKDSQHQQPLWYVALNGHEALVTLLLARGAMVNPLAVYAKGPLFAAAGKGHQEIVEKLLAAGADVNAVTDINDTALSAAATNGHQEVVEKLLAAGANVNIIIGTDRTALSAAAGSGHQEIVEKLLAAGADVRSLYGGSALLAAAGHGHQEIVEKLLVAGADANALTSVYDCKTILVVAARNGHQEIVEKLLAAGADANAFTKSDEETALSAAAGYGYQEIVEKLLAAGADANAVTGSWAKTTALMAAAENGHLEIVERLLAAGANINAAFSKDTALTKAAENGHQEIVDKLLTAGADISGTALAAAVLNGDQRIVEKLLAAGANPNSTDGFRTPALAIAAGRGYQKFVEKLLAAGADVNACIGPAVANNFALVAAVKNGHQEIVETLLAAGANVTFEDPWGRTVHIVKIAAHRGYQAIVEKLLAAGAQQ
ncbi:Ankyrin repeat protein [Trichoderma simmonsii]|uniref:Ankyrin repeat protein n=1 Tax=Trichoderma simmonsii TaxID=1491479 RepID=A0A8G0LTV3_9HYPO|nr:Ankyrin repeat protein [Trichoderma simmonsii]